jgi:hypothetical protein
MSEGLERTVAHYSKADGSFVGEWPLKELSLAELRTLVGAPEGDPLYDSYPVGPLQVKSLEGRTGAAFDLDRFDYFIECHATEGAT